MESNSRLNLQHVRVATHSADESGCLVFTEDRLVAVIVHLADAMHAELIGSWFLEAGFGPCAVSVPPTFETFDAAQAWIEAQLDADAAVPTSRSVSGGWR